MCALLAMLLCCQLCDEMGVDRFLDIASVFDGTSLAGQRVLVTGAVRNTYPQAPLLSALFIPLIGRWGAINLGM